MSLEGRRVKMFRCHLDPHIPPRARNAFMMGDGPEQMSGEAIYIPGEGVHLKANVKDPSQNVIYREFLVPLANLENIEFIIEEKKKPSLKPVS